LLLSRSRSHFITLQEPRKPTRSYLVRSIDPKQSFPFPDLLTGLAFDNRYPNWIPRRYELQPEYGAGETESELSGLPNDNNTQAWDSFIQRWSIHSNVSRSSFTDEKVD
jgi:hypothetical protein